jgi:hypothetical protein
MVAARFLVRLVGMDVIQERGFRLYSVLLNSEVCVVNSPLPYLAVGGWTSYVKLGGQGCGLHR